MITRTGTGIIHGTPNGTRTRKYQLERLVTVPSLSTGATINNTGISLFTFTRLQRARNPFSLQVYPANGGILQVAATCPDRRVCRLR